MQKIVIAHTLAQIGINGRLSHRQYIKSENNINNKFEHVFVGESASVSCVGSMKSQSFLLTFKENMRRAHFKPRTAKFLPPIQRTLSSPWVVPNTINYAPLRRQSEWVRVKLSDRNLLLKCVVMPALEVKLSDLDSSFSPLTLFFFVFLMYILAIRPRVYV